MTRRVLLLAAALVLLAGCSHQRSATAPTTTLPVGLPKMTVTPGVVLTTSTADVCTLGWASKHRHGLTAKQKVAVLRAYGYPKDQRVAEWDHYVSLELGGGNGVQNIFPMIDRAQAMRKDRLEDRLHDEVCTGRQTLSVAQAHIRQYWLWW